MVQSRINIIDSDCVDTKLLHKRGVTETIGTVAQRVGVGGGTEGVRAARLVTGKTVSRSSLTFRYNMQRTRHQLSESDC